MNQLSDCWQTPQWLFDELNQEFNFELDLCASIDNAKMPYFGDYFKLDLSKSMKMYSEAHGFSEYTGGSCFMNPPYSNPKPFIEKAWEDSKHCKIVCLLPNTIKTCKYMDILDANKGNSTFRQWLPGLEIRDLSRRTGFVHPEKESSSPSFGCMLLIMDRRGL